MIISYKSQSVPEQLYAPDSDWLFLSAFLSAFFIGFLNRIS